MKIEKIYTNKDFLKGKITVLFSGNYTVLEELLTISGITPTKDILSFLKGDILEVNPKTKILVNHGNTRKPIRKPMVPEHLVFLV